MSSLRSCGSKRFQLLKTIFVVLAINLVVPDPVLLAGNRSLSPEEAIKDAVVKIYTVINAPDYFRPWNAHISRASGSGCIISGHRILTNAHVVANQAFIEVRRHGQPQRYKAKVLSVAHEVDLALLTVDDKDFFSNVEPLKLGELPKMQHDVLVYGFPMGGDALSVTRGVVSRIEHRQYVHSSEYFLAAQIDAAINPGNSGGPVLADSRVVGVVMQGYRSADNIGYMVPVVIVDHFLRDIQDGSHDGFPGIGMAFQPMENPDVKRKYGMSRDQTGVLVVKIFPGSSAAGALREEDVILTVDGHDVADDGTVEFRPNERTALNYCVQKHQVGEKISLSLLRDSATTEITFNLDRRASDFQLVPNEQYDQLPRYFIYGGIVFSPLTKNLVKTFGKNAPNNLVVELSNWPTETKREVVVALQVLASEVNKGYHGIGGRIVEEVNGRTFKDFDEFYQLVTNSQEPFMTFKDKKGFQIVIDRKKALESNEEILQTYRIDADRSHDLEVSEEAH